jgi:glutathione S-transferase
MDVNNGQDTLTLYNFPVSTCSQKVKLTLAEKDLSFTNFEVDWRNEDHLSSWYLAINPNGVVPTLKHGTRIVIDSSVINEYLDEVFPNKPLLPREPYARAKVRSWRQYIDEVPTTAIRIPSFNLVILKNMKNLTEEAFAARATKRPLRKHFYQKMSPSGFSQLEFDQALERLRQTLERMERALAETRWVASDEFSIADISLMPTIVRLDDLGLSRLWSDLPEVQSWYTRCQERPSFAATFYPGARFKVSTTFDD